jgi:protease stability complex PrcB-like protein
MKATMGLLLFAFLGQGTLPLRGLDKGDQSNVGEARQVVVRTAAEWDALWRQHSPDRDQPRVDFSREMAVGVFLGSRTTAGFDVAIVGAEMEGGSLVVRFRETRPPTGSVTAQVITSPYHLAAVPRQSGTVKFEKVQ